ncbi:MAG: hypothetical protein HUN04_22670 [Desulfobacter sp.]|nr:MAG: hypothetical protein HUN04_22670 [Desulfobacter sp.]
MIETKLKTGQITQEEYDLVVSELDKKYEDMWKRLDGTYRVGGELGD